jgi:hypothetical protein
VEAKVMKDLEREPTPPPMSNCPFDRNSKTVHIKGKLEARGVSPDPDYIELMSESVMEIERLQERLMHSVPYTISYGNVSIPASITYS